MLLVVMAFLLRQALVLRFGIPLPPFILVYPAVVVVALVLGLRYGLLATATGSILALVWMFPPVGQLGIAAYSGSIGLCVFAILGILISFFAARYRRHERRLAALESRRELGEVRQRAECAMASISDAVFLSDEAGNLLDFNEAFAIFHRFKSKAECPRALADYPALIELFTSDGQPARLEQWPVSMALRGRSGSNVEYGLRRTDSGETWVGSYSFNPMRDENGAIAGTVTVARDITAQKRAEDALRASETRYRTAFQTIPDSLNISRLDDGLYMELNDGFQRITGYERREVLGKTSLELELWADAEDRARFAAELVHNSTCRDFETRLQRKNGEIFPVLISASLIDLEGVACILSVTRDISKAKAAEEEIRTLAFFDPLTGLANRRTLTERLRKGQADRGVGKRALLIADLDHFKNLNDTLGHATGDLLLREVARRIGCSVRKGDTVGRMGGDEFVVMLEGLSDDQEAAAAEANAVAEKILAAVERPYQLDGHECLSACSIGITVFDDSQLNINDFLQQADIAMYQAKGAGRNAARFFAPALQAAVNSRAELEEDLRQGIKRGQFVLYYQPQIEDGQVVGAEALLRWNHPLRGLRDPGEFIPLAEETRLILPLGSWVLETACRQIAAWAGCERTRDLTIAVNISALQLRHPDFTGHVLAIVARTRANPHNLKLEMTETMLMDNMEDVIAKMRVLRSHGLKFSVDDFGTGYSSLAYLKRFPLDQLKIDRSFVRDIVADPGSCAIARTIISLSMAMGLPVIAEGVETEQQRQLLASLGCIAYQGFFFSRPVPIEQFELLLPAAAGSVDKLPPSPAGNPSHSGANAAFSPAA